MDKLTVEQEKDCWICFSNENNLTLAIVNSEKMLKNCHIYLPASIILNSLKNMATVSCCRFCYESAYQLTLLEEQAQKLQKEISDLRFEFTKNVLERRSGSSTAKEEVAIVDVETEVLESEESSSEELISESLTQTERENIATDARLDSQSVPDVVETATPNIAPNQRMMSTTNAPSDPQTTKTSVADSIKSLKTPIIRLERIWPCRSRNSPKIVSDSVEENIKCVTALNASSEPINCSETLSKEPQFKCRDISCSKSFKSTADSIANQQKIHSGDGRHQCSVCWKSFGRATHLKNHERIHSGEKPHKCSFCPKSFGRSDHRRRHERTHSIKKLHKC